MNKTFTRVGWRARIGIIKPAAGYADIAGFHQLAPEGVALTATVVSNPHTQPTPAQLARLGEHVADAAKILAPAKPDVIIFNCTSGSFIKGFGYDQELIKKIKDATGIPATTTTTAVMEAFRALGIKKLCMATPYIDSVNEREKKFLEDNGFEVLKYKGLQILEGNEIANVEPYKMYQLARQVFQPEADGIFISCTALHVIDIIEKLEYDLGKPVVTSNQAAFWSTFRMAGVKEPINGYGKLFRDF